MGTPLRRIVGLLTMSCVTSLAVLALAGAAFAAEPVTTWSGHIPAPGTVLTSLPPTFKVSAASTARFVAASRVVTVDGVTRTASCFAGSSPKNGLFSANVYWAADFPQSDGPHTVSVTLGTYSGVPVTTTWDYAVSIAPILGNPSPSAGTVVTSQTTAIAIPASDNGVIGSVTARLNGEVVPAVYSNGYVHVLPTAPLANDAAASVSVTVTDLLGNTATRNWAFEVQVYPDMQPSVADDCGSCHPEQDQPAHHLNADDCNECHYGAAHPGRPWELHGRADVSQCSGCHVSSITMEHNRYDLGCSACHGAQAAPAVKAAVAASSTACTSCHASADHESLHTWTGQQPSCSGCHAASSLTVLHINPDTSLSCATCHESTDPEVVATIAADSLECSGCHTAQGTDYHADFDVTHTYSAMAPGCIGSGCHENTLVDAHQPFVGSGNRYPQYADACALCHVNDDPGRVPVGATAACADCHAEIHPDLAEAHTATLSPASMSILGLDVGTHACSECHASADLRTLHGGEASCGTCHPSPASSATPWGKGCVQGGCHTTGSSAPQHDALDTSHATTPKGCTSTAGCHSGGTNIAAIHTQQGCSACHAAGTTPSADCVSCHDMGAPHGDDRAIHATSVTAGNVRLFDNHDGMGQLTWWLDCNLCHESANVLDLHADCATCHSGPRDTFTTWNKTCQQGSCHVTYHEEAVPAHENEYRTNDCETNCHNGDWSVPLENCGFCHTFSDRTAPVTSSNAKPSYLGAARIVLTTYDAFPTSGVAHTYYAVDGGTTTEGSTIIVPAPATGTESHTVRFWSVDNDGNVETTKTVSFTLSPDSTPPETEFGGSTANVGPASITLSATDNGTSGVKATYYRLDGGPVMTGSSFTVPEPVSGTQVHSLEFWSVDWSENEEGHQTVEFSVTKDAVAPTGSVVINSGAAYTTSSFVTLTLAASDPGGSGVSQMRFSNDNLTWSAWTTYSAAPRGHSLSSGNGAKTVWVQYRDVAGNVSTFSDGITFDNVAPTGSIAIDNGAASTTTSLVTLNLSATDAVAGMNDMRFSTNGSTWGAWQPYATTASFTLTSGSGTKYAYVQFRDNAGNVRTYSDTITLSASDATAPTGSIVVDGGAATTTTQVVSLTLSATDTGGSGLSQMRFSNDNSTWSTWETYATSKSWSLQAGDGAKTVYVQYRDGAGNVSPAYSDGILFDGSAPTGSIAINGGASSTTTHTVTLTLSATDTAGSGLSQMRFSNDNSTWTTWETYATSKSWSLLTGEGARTVYVQFRDGAGNVSAVFSDGISLSEAVGTSTLVFTWHPPTWSEAHLRVRNASGVTVADEWVSGTGAELDLSVAVLSGQDYYLECVYFYDEYWDEEGGPYGIWTSDTSINPDGVLSPGETVTWSY